MKSVPKALVFGFALSAVSALAAAQTQVRPGFNLFSAEQDIELGRQSAAQVERQIPMVSDPSVQRYVEAIGRRLSAAAPGPRFPYQFKVTNLSDVNAFALPGGFLYVNRGLIELVPTEGQLAGVLAHEIAHVALRHQTNQVSKAYLAKAGVGILGGVLSGGGGSGGIMEALGGLGLNALFLKFSRTAESQADIVGAQIMAHAGYDANEMADMFELLRRQAGRDPGKLERFLSDHPAPADREARVRQEAARLGRPGVVRPAGDLPAVRLALRGQPPAASMKQIAQGGDAPAPDRGPVSGAVRIEQPSSRFRTFEQRNRFFTIQYPDNWRPSEAPNGLGVTIVPQGGAVQTRDGQSAIVAGVVVNHYVPFEGTTNGRTGARGPFSGKTSLDDATNDLVTQLTRSNPYLSLVRGSAKRQTIDGARAISLVLSGRSPVTGEEERVTLFTRELPDGHVLYSLFIAPGRDAGAFSAAYDRMISTLRVNDEAAHR